MRIKKTVLVPYFPEGCSGKPSNLKAEYRYQISIEAGPDIDYLATVSAEHLNVA
jgi:hypothetical protein